VNHAGYTATVTTDTERKALEARMKVYREAYEFLEKMRQARLDAEMTPKVIEKIEPVRCRRLMLFIK
jgi:hypothetical protein